MTTSTEIKNDSTRPGETASEIEVIENRYRLFACHSRFDNVSWMVEDMQVIDRLTNGYDVIVIEFSRDDALVALENHKNKKSGFRR